MFEHQAAGNADAEDINPALASKSNRCELNSDPTMFCTTTTSPIHSAKPLPRNSSKCAIHMAHSTAAPSSPSWIATANV